MTDEHYYTKTQTRSAEGALQSPADARDYTINMFLPPGTTAAVFPTEFTLIRPTRIKDQGAIHSCVGFALALCRDIQETLQGNAVETSPGMIYANRAPHHWQGEKMFTREALEMLVQDGTCLEQTFPHNFKFHVVRAKFNQNKEKYLACARPKRITAYMRLWNEREIKTALLNIGPVAVDYLIFASFFRTGCDGIVTIPDRWHERLYGGHLMVIVGWRIINGAEHWIVVNSWGAWWGDGGLCYIPITSMYPFRDAWSMTDSIYPANDVYIRKINFYIDPEKSREIWLDGISFTLPTRIVLQNDRILVPLRFIAQALGCLVVWDDRTRTATVTRGDSRVTMTLDSRWYTATNPEIGIQETFQMDTVPIVINDFIMIPLRFLAQHLACTVEWDADARKATIVRNQ